MLDTPQAIYGWCERGSALSQLDLQRLEDANQSKQVGPGGNIAVIVIRIEKAGFPVSADEQKGSKAP
ncbi:hypothetical protein GL300_18410 [Paracoccus litorisediminis]|uniref:Uncharacterized protein n=1 Tax=Paracoccus litorisediminis TaxID=2006130 RepID=A0A844HS76_9RHOB|nr:hypothetical protein [Paracoccus litorisediminis]